MAGRLGVVMRIALIAVTALVTVLAALPICGGGTPHTQATDFAPTGATFAPTRFDDPEPDGCQPNDCSLREAVRATNDNPGHDTITLSPGQYDVNLVTTYHGEEFTAPLRVSDDTTLVGAGADRTRLDGEGVGGVLEIWHPTFAPISVDISDLAIQDGLGPIGGGAIYARDGVSLRIDRVSMTGNGGGGGRGGAILTWGNSTTITDSLIADNWTQLGVVYGSPLTITNSTVSGNEGISGPGGIVSATATLTNVTITGNSGPPDSPNGVWDQGGDTTIRNSIIAGNTGRQCGGTTSLGHNVYSDDSCGLGPGDLPSTDPLLGPLGDNGGPTLTHALLAGSPAINSGDNNGCPPTDQRGVARPQEGICDIGSYEYVPSATPAPTPEPAVVMAPPSPAPSPTVAPDPPTPTVKASPSPTAKPFPSRTPRRSQTPSPDASASAGDDAGGSGGLIIGLTLAGLAVAGAGGGGGYYFWRRSAAGLRLRPP